MFRMIFRVHFSDEGDRTVAVAGKPGMGMFCDCREWFARRRDGMDACGGESAVNAGRGKKSIDLHCLYKPMTYLLDYVFLETTYLYNTYICVHNWGGGGSVAVFIALR